MPNHCEADMKITGPAEAVGEFLAKYVTLNDGSCLDLDKIRPYPEQFNELDRLSKAWDEASRALPRDENGKAATDVWQEFVARMGPRPKDGFNSGGYEWCVENWGTKWGCYDGSIQKIDDGVILHFLTAWSPFKIELLEQVSAEFPSLRFKYDYYERGMSFQGHVVVVGGKTRSNRQSDYRGSRGG